MTSFKFPSLGCKRGREDGDGQITASQILLSRISTWFPLFKEASKSVSLYFVINITHSPKRLLAIFSFNDYKQNIWRTGCLIKFKKEHFLSCVDILLSWVFVVVLHHRGYVLKKKKKAKVFQKAAFVSFRQKSVHVFDFL